METLRGAGSMDEWGNQLNEENPHHLHQPYRLPGQQYDEGVGAVLQPEPVLRSVAGAVYHSGAR